jgi:hypothetical protein
MAWGSSTRRRSRQLAASRIFKHVHRKFSTFKRYPFQHFFHCIFNYIYIVVVDLVGTCFASATHVSYFQWSSKMRNAELYILHCLGFFFFFFICPHKRGWWIRTSDLRFMRCGLQPIELPLVDHFCPALVSLLCVKIYFYFLKKLKLYVKVGQRVYRSV